MLEYESSKQSSVLPKPALSFYYAEMEVQGGEVVKSHGKIVVETGGWCFDCKVFRPATLLISYKIGVPGLPWLSSS